jgi:hypothetical protein
MVHGIKPVHRQVGRGWRGRAHQIDQPIESHKQSFGGETDSRDGHVVITRESAATASCSPAYEHRFPSGILCRMYSPSFEDLAWDCNLIVPYAFERTAATERITLEMRPVLTFVCTLRDPVVNMMERSPMYKDGRYAGFPMARFHLQWLFPSNTSLVVEKPGHPASSEARDKRILIVPDGFKGTEVNGDSSKLRDGPYNE